MERRALTWLLGPLLAACSTIGAVTTPSGVAPSGSIASAVPIQSVQGNSASSPLEGQSVTVEGIVSGDFQDNDADTSRNLGGFFLQGVADVNPDTSDAVFVFDGDTPLVDVSVGDAVRVSGTVTEYYGETQIAASKVVRTGNGEIRPIDLSLPAAAAMTNSDGQLIGDLERWEGMLVRLPQALTVADLWELEEHGSMLLTAGGNQYQYTNQHPPDRVGFLAHNEAVARRRIMLDDGLRAARPMPVPYLPVRVGDQVSNLTGNLRYSRGTGGRGVEGYRLMPTADPQFTAVNPRPEIPFVAGSLKVASFNVLQLFSTLDTGADVCGPGGDGACLGANSLVERRRQLSKIVAALGAIDADIVGILELENNPVESLRLLVEALNTVLGAGTYAYVDTGITGPQPIKCAILYKPATVSLAGTVAVLDSDADARFDEFKSRPVLAQTFAQKSGGATLTVAVGHLKSKGSDCNASGDPDRGDGQGNCNLTRTQAAVALADWLASHPTGSVDDDVLIIGDMNAHFFEDPLAALEDAGFVNVLESYAGPRGYSYVFDGQRGALDQALASPTLVPQLTGVSEWHINADEAPVLDYNLENGRDPSLFDAATPYRSSDHDPLVIGLDLLP